MGPPLWLAVRFAWWRVLATARLSARPPRGQVGVEPYPVQSAHSERGERPLILEASELTLDPSALAYY